MQSEPSQGVMEQADSDSYQTTPPRNEIRSPCENDLLITRLVARIAELEEKLYKKELEAPAIGGGGAFRVHADGACYAWETTTHGLRRGSAVDGVCTGANASRAPCPIPQRSPNSFSS
jgi:hypothetical protein